MQNGQKYANYKKSKNDDGNFTCIITVDGEDVEVSEAVYNAYASGERKMRYMEFDLKHDRVLQGTDGKAILDENGCPIVLPEREVSLDKLISEDWDFPDPAFQPDDFVIGRLQIEALHGCLDLLETEEQELISALFFNGISEREYAKSIELSKTALHSRKMKVLKKLKKMLD